MSLILHNTGSFVLGDLQLPHQPPVVVHVTSKSKECRFNCWKTGEGSFIQKMDWVKLVSTQEMSLLKFYSEHESHI